jgi:hypothetical protein
VSTTTPRTESPPTTRWIAISVLVTGLVVAAIILLATGNGLVGGMKAGPQRCAETVADPAAREECGRLLTFANRLLDQQPHAPFTSTALFEAAPPGGLAAYSGYHDFAIVAFKLSDDTKQAFYVRCGAGLARNLCFDLRPIKPGEGTPDTKASHPDPVPVQ